VVEAGPTADLIAEPMHPYTRALVAAVPVPRVDQDRAPLPIRGALSDAPLDGVGCAFRDRCPHAFDRCEAETPPLRGVGAGRSVACHLGAPA
jgi:oligopeptide/dipeptide ABC transporter ATP-binding protein